MKLSEIIDLINEIENKFPVDEWVVDNIHVWPFIRMQLSIDPNIYSNNGNSNSTESLIKKLWRIAFREFTNYSKFMYAYLKDYNKNAKPIYPVDIILLSDGVSYCELNGTWFEKLCDPFIDYCNQNNVCTLLLSPFHIYFIPRHTPSIFLQPKLSFAIGKAIIRSYRESKALKIKLAGYKEFEDYWRSKNLPVLLPSSESIKKHVVQIREIAGFYKKILQKAKPRLAFQVSYYGQCGYAFNLACRDLDIPSIDIQHGVQGDLHGAYGRWNKVPKDGYELLPTYFWCWSSYEADAINKWSAHVTPWHHAIAGGNLFLEMWIKGDKGLVEHYDNIINGIKPIDSKVQILYTLNGIETNDDLFNLVKLIGHTPSKYFWWLRCHPCRLGQKGEIKKLLTLQNIKNADTESATDLPLYALLRHVDLHITMYSSTVIEAEKFEVPSVVTSQYGSELYPEQIASGWALPAYTTDEIVKAIEYQLNNRDSLIEAKKGKDSLNSNQALEGLLHMIGK